MHEFRHKLLEIVKEAQVLHSCEKDQMLKSIELVGQLRWMNAATAIGMSLGDFAKYIGLTRDQFLKRSQVALVFRLHPHAKTLFTEGKYDLTHLVLIAPKITQANSDVIFEKTAGMAKRELQAFLLRLSSGGELSDAEGTVEVSLTFTESQMKILDRAREVLSHGGKVPGTVSVLLAALDELLDRRDPMRKAARAMRRQEAKSAKGAAKAQEKESEESQVTETDREDSARANIEDAPAPHSSESGPPGHGTNAALSNHKRECGGRGGIRHKRDRSNLHLCARCPGAPSKN